MCLKRSAAEEFREIKFIDPEAKEMLKSKSIIFDLSSGMSQKRMCDEYFFIDVVAFSDTFVTIFIYMYYVSGSRLITVINLIELPVSRRS